MFRITFLLGAFLAGAVAATTGCVPLPVYNRTLEENERCRDIIGALETKHKDVELRLKELDHKAKSLEIQNEYLKSQAGLAEDAVRKATEELQKALKREAENAGLETEMQGGDIRITKEGKISIAGDVLFAPGSADLTTKAKKILKKLVPMLKDRFKDNYIRVEGHTDDQPIKKPETRKKFPTNWHLSVERAASVLLELKSLGIPEKRMYAAGYGEFKPRVPNKPNKDGHPENRRVEIAIVSSK